jgi:hypothetical protein
MVRNFREGKKKIPDQYEILLSKQPLRRNPEHPLEAQCPVGVQKPTEKLTHPFPSGPPADRVARTL